MYTQLTTWMTTLTPHGSGLEDGYYTSATAPAYSNTLERECSFAIQVPRHSTWNVHLHIFDWPMQCVVRWGCCKSRPMFFAGQPQFFFSRLCRDPLCAKVVVSLKWLRCVWNAVLSQCCFVDLTTALENYRVSLLLHFSKLWHVSAYFT